MTEPDPEIDPEIETEEKRRLLWLRRIAIGLGITVAAIVVLVLIALGVGRAWLGSDRGQQRIAALVEDQLSGLLVTGRIEVERVRVRLRDLELEGVHVWGPEREVVTIPRATTTLGTVGWSALLGQQIWLGETRVVDPYVRWQAAEDWPTFASDDDPDAPVTWMIPGWGLQVDALMVTGARVEGPGVRLQQGEIAAEVSASEHELGVDDLVATWATGEPALGDSRAEGSVAFRGADLDAVALSLRTADAQLNLAGRVGQLLGDAPVLALEAATTGGPQLLAAFGTEPFGPGWSGGWLVDGTIEGALATPDLSLEAFVLQAPSLERPDGASPALTAEVVPTSSAMEAATVALTVPELAALAPLGAPFEAGNLGLSGTVTRGPEGIGADVTVSGSGVVARGGVRVGSLALPVVVTQRTRDGGVMVLEARSPNARVTGLAVGDTVVGALGGRFDVVMDGDVITASTRLREAGGGRRVTLEARADLAARTAVTRALEIDLGPDLTWRQQDPTRVSWNDQGITHVHVDLRSSAGRVKVEGDALGGEPLAVRASVQDLDLATARAIASPLLSEPLPAMEGTLTASVDPVGSRRAPKWAWSTRVSGLTVEGYATGIDAEGSGSLDPGQFVGALEARYQGLLLTTVRATLPLRRPAPTSFEIRCYEGEDRTIGGADVAWSVPRRPVTEMAEALPLLDLQPLADLGLDPGALNVEGKLTFSGLPCDPVWALETKAATPVAERAVEVTLLLDGEPDNLALARVGVAVGGARRIDGQFTIAHPKPGDALSAEAVEDVIQSFEGRVTVRDLPTLWGASGLGGRVSGQTSVSGRGSEVRALNGAALWTPAKDSAFDRPVQASWRTEEGTIDVGVDLTVADNVPAAVRLQAQLLALQREGTEASFSGEISRLTLTGAQVAALSQGALTDGTGEATMEGELGGTVGSPDALLSLRVRDAGFTVPAVGVRYESMQIVARTEGQRAFVERGSLVSRPVRHGLRTNVTSPPLQITGTVGLENGEMVPDLRVKLDRSWLMATRTATVRASGTVRLGSIEDRFLLAGQLRVDEGRYVASRDEYVSDAGSQLHPDIRFTGAPPPALLEEEVAESASVPDLFDLDLDLDMGNGVELSATVPLTEQAERVARVSDVEVSGELDGNLKVLNRAGDLRLRGRLGVEGRVNLLTARFEVAQGSITFSGDDITSPDVDLGLRRETASYGTVTARVTGTPEDLEVSELSSDQFQDQQDIISILLMGRPLSQLQSGTGASSSDLVQGVLLSVAGNQVEQVLGGNVFDQVSYNQTEGLTVGWALSSNSTLTVSVDPTADLEESAEAELTILLSRGVEAGIRSGITGSGSAWIIWRTRF